IERGIEIPITKASPYSIDVNLWGRSCETGVLEDPWVTPPADAYDWTVAPSDAPAHVELVIEFEGGIPVAIDGERLAPVELVGRRSPLSLYDKNLATYDTGDAFDHAAAVGFISIFGLPLRVEAARHGAVGARYGAAWTWTDPLLDGLPTSVTDPSEPVAAR